MVLAERQSSGPADPPSGNRTSLCGTGLKTVLSDDPGLRSFPGNALGRAHEKTWDMAAIEAGLDISDVPSACPFAIEHVMDDEFFGT
jgi:hypothetical protein